MRVALLGLSHPHSDILLTTFGNMPEITSVVLWDADALLVANTKLAQRPKVTLATANLDQALSQPDLQFALVCVRHDQADAVALRVIAAGIHLLSEKPVALTSTDILSIQEAAARRGVVASVLYGRRAHPCMVVARKMLREGAIGKLTSLETRFLTTQVRFRNPKHWLFHREHSGGGILLWLGCHCLDLLHHVTNDEITEVSGFLATQSGESINVEDTATLALRFRSGALGTFHASYSLAFSGQGYVNTKGYDSYLGFNGRDGRIVWPSLDPLLQIEAPPQPGQAAIRQQTFTLPESKSYGGAPGEVFIRWFIAATQGRAAPPATLADALRTARVIEAAELSSQTGRAVKVVPTPSVPAPELVG
ncbi:MAG TPA: Gfo/Idh/MocA family oxidoreductase [Lacunisphaera sp.]|jgi:predicted dehydrogenase|nr:Gfo/Idh/MocA family oxidoreductase [Lacunisphaera sp.]